MNRYIERGAASVMVGCFVVAMSAEAASFDCGKAQSKVERMICDNPELSKLDDELAQSYKAVLKDQSNADKIKQAQMRWMKERNGCADVACVRSAYKKRNEQLQVTNNATVRTAEPIAMVTPDKPGYYRLDKSNDDKVCQSLGRIINADIKKYGETRFDEHDEFVRWNDVDEEKIDRGTERIYGGRVEQADADINNDGVVDQVFRSKWALAGVELDALHVHSQGEPEKINVDELVREDTRNISFIGSNYWLDRYQKKYGDPTLRYQQGYSGPGWDWYFETGVSIDLVRLYGSTYLVSREFPALPRAITAEIMLKDFEAQPNASAKIFVFQLDKEYRKYEESDVCMFVRTCPCGGCKDVRGTTEERRALPAKKWCNK